MLCSLLPSLAGLSDKSQMLMLGVSIKSNLKCSIFEGISIHNYFVCYCVFCDVSVYFQSFISTISPSLKVSLLRVLRWDGGLSRSLLWSFLLMWKCAGRGSQSLDTSSSQTQRLARVTTPIQHSQLSPTEEFRQTDPSLDNEKLNRLKTSLHWFDPPAVLGVWIQHWYSETMRAANPPSCPGESETGGLLRSIDTTPFSTPSSA